MTLGRQVRKRSNSDVNKNTASIHTNLRKGDIKAKT